MKSALCSWLLLTAAVALSSGTAAASPQFTVLHSFTGGHDGGVPYAALIADANGALYGTTYQGGSHNLGTAFRLTPPAAGQTAWSETVLHDFAGGGNTGDGDYPTVGLVFDPIGNLFGMTSGNGDEAKDAGTIFELSSPASGSNIWTHKVLRHFTGVHGGIPMYGALVFDSQGALYGTTYFGSATGSDGRGNVFKLSPPVAGEQVWQLTQLYGFTAGGAHYPEGGLVFDQAGALYGTTMVGPGSGSGADGCAYQLKPPTAGHTGWTETDLVDFSPATHTGFPQAGLLIDPSGNLYGTTAAPVIDKDPAGGIFRLSPPSKGESAWTYTKLYSFKGDYTIDGMIFGSDASDGAIPFSSLIEDGNGVLYGTTTAGGSTTECSAPAQGLGCGTVFQLTPPKTGHTIWTETVLYRFTGGNDGALPYAGLLLIDGALYGTTSAGGASGKGTVFRIVP